MFKKLFSKTSKPQTKLSSAVTVKKGQTEFLGDVTGDAASLDALRLHVGKTLSTYPDIKNAWLAKIKHQSEDIVRLSLVLDCEELNPTDGHDIATKCAEFVSIDVMHKGMFPEKIIKNITKFCEPLFKQGCNLYVIPLIVKQGDNETMPKNWDHGIQMYIVADLDIDRAMNRAVAEAQIQEFQLEGVFDNKLLGIDPPDAWWENFVLERWAEHQETLPDQSVVNVLVKTGGLIRGICLQGHEDTNKSFDGDNFQ